MRSRKKSTDTLKQMKIRTQQLKIYGTSESSSYRKIHSITRLSQEQYKSQINNLTSHIKVLEKEEQTKPKVNRKKEIIKIRAEIHDLDS